MTGPAAGTFATCVLHTGELASSARHYRDVLGWELEDLHGVAAFTRGGRRVAVAYTGSAVPDAWVPAVAVQDVDTSTNAAVDGGATAVGGLLPVGEGWPVDPRWQPIVAVDDLSRAVERARAAGGVPQVGPLDVPAAGTLTSVCDPRGALYVLVQPRDRTDD